MRTWTWLLSTLKLNAACLLIYLFIDFVFACLCVLYKQKQNIAMWQKLDFKWVAYFFFILVVVSKWTPQLHDEFTVHQLEESTSVDKIKRP